MILESKIIIFIYAFIKVIMPQGKISFCKKNNSISELGINIIYIFYFLHKYLYCFIIIHRYIGITF